MRIATLAFVVLGLIGCSQPPAPTEATTELPPAAPAPVKSDAELRADALLADLENRQREQARKDRENPPPPPPTLNTFTREAPTAAPAPRAYVPSSVSESIPESTIERLRPPIDILSSSYAITERNDTWWRFSWKMSIRNQERSPMSIRAGMEFQDSRGFILDTNDEYQTIDGSTITEISGFALIRSDQAAAVTQARAVARKLR